jgi:predicted nucleic acid-binding protein
LTLVTNNSKHFSRIEGLKITNWSVYPEKNA